MTQTATQTMRTSDPGLRRVGRLMRTVGILAIVAGVAAVAVGLWLLEDFESLLTRSLDLTAESLTTVDSSLGVATDTVEVVGSGLAESERTSRGLQTTLDDGAGLLSEAARLTRNEVADSLEAVQTTLPTIIQVGGTIDSTLRTVDQLGGPEYAPEEPFDQTLQALEENLDGLPEDLRSQADAIDLAGENLRTVGTQGVAVADAISDARDSLDEAAVVLGEYRSAAGQAKDLIDDTRADLDRRMLLLRILVVVLGVIYCAGQLLPLYLGHRLARAFADDA